MSLKKYLCCDDAHTANLEYVCLKQKRAFCLKCWIKSEHYAHCQSTRCGNATKLAHTTINRALEYRNFKILENMCGNLESFDQLRIRFLQLNFQVGQILRDFIEQKMPLLVWNMVNQLLESKAGSEDIPGVHKFDSTCADMLRVIKGEGKKVADLEEAVGAYFDINRTLEGDAKRVRSGGFHSKPAREDQAEEVADNIINSLKKMLEDLKRDIRKNLDDHLQANSQKLDKSLKYKGVVFHKNQKYETFRKREQYPYVNQLAQNSNLTNEQQELYNGYYLNVPQLESNPEQLLQVSKCFLKDKLFSVHESINSLKSAFPYKFAYPMATSLTPDQDYELTVVELEKASIESPTQTNPFLSSLNIVVMGRELVMVRFHNQPKFTYSLKIYNYKQDRQPYYAALIEELGLSAIPQRQATAQTRVRFTEDLTEAELVYCHFQTVYETLFLSGNEQLIFEGERVMSNRGAELFLEAVEKWRSVAQLELPFSHALSRDELLKLFA